MADKCVGYFAFTRHYFLSSIATHANASCPTVILNYETTNDRIFRSTKKSCRLSKTQLSCSYTRALHSPQKIPGKRIYGICDCSDYDDLWHIPQPWKLHSAIVRLRKESGSFVCDRHVHGLEVVDFASLRQPCTHRGLTDAFVYYAVTAITTKLVLP